MAAEMVAFEGGPGGERFSGTSTGAEPGGFGQAEQSVLAALHAADGPLPPADLIRDLECAGFRNPEIRSAIWHLLDRHRVRLTRDLRLVLPVTPAPPAPTPGS
ncbi:MAG: hypothetical protein ACTHQE_14800 [Thermomicrobiales bacterium]